MGAVGSVSHMLLDVTTGLQSTCYVPTHTLSKVLEANVKQTARVAVKQSSNLACQRERHHVSSWLSVATLHLHGQLFSQPKPDSMTPGCQMKLSKCDQ